MKFYIIYFEDGSVVMYERMTEKYSYYPEFQKNIHYYNGWRTNKAHKIGKKVILPCNAFGGYNDSPQFCNVREILHDLEKVLNYFDGNITTEVDLSDTLRREFSYGNTKNIHLKYFDVTFYKKGTAHITFTNEKLIERYNIYISKKKNWLPPSYGEKTYKNMTDEEKAVIDSFQSEEQYNEVISNAAYYLAPISQQGTTPLFLTT